MKCDICDLDIMFSERKDLFKQYIAKNDINSLIENDKSYFNINDNSENKIHFFNEIRPFLSRENSIKIQAQINNKISNLNLFFVLKPDSEIIKSIDKNKLIRLFEFITSGYNTIEYEIVCFIKEQDFIYLTKKLIESDLIKSLFDIEEYLDSDIKNKISSINKLMTVLINELGNSEYKEKILIANNLNISVFELNKLNEDLTIHDGLNIS